MNKLTPAEQQLLEAFKIRLENATIYHCKRAQKGGQVSTRIRAFEKQIGAIRQLFKETMAIRKDRLAPEYLIRETYQSMGNLLRVSKHGLIQLSNNKKKKGRSAILSQAGDIALLLFSELENLREQRSLKDEIGRYISIHGPLMTAIDSKFGNGTFRSMNFPVPNVPNSDGSREGSGDKRWERGYLATLRKQAKEYVKGPPFFIWYYQEFDRGRISPQEYHAYKVENHFNKIVRNGGFSEYERHLGDVDEFMRKIFSL